MLRRNTRHYRAYDGVRQAPARQEHTYLVYTLERVRTQLLDEWRAQRMPVVVPEV